MRFIESICLAFVLDLLIGDPIWIPHPVVLMGKCITALEHFLRPRFPQTPKGEQAAGRVVAVVLPVVTFALTAGILYGAYRLHPVAAFVLHTFWCAQALAVKDMLKESRNVAREVSLAGPWLVCVLSRPSPDCARYAAHAAPCRTCTVPAR